MKWYEEQNRETQREINVLSGLLNLPAPHEYENLSAFIHTVSMRISEARCLVRRANDLLTNEDLK